MEPLAEILQFVTPEIRNPGSIIDVKDMMDPG